MGTFGPQTELGKELYEETDGLGGLMTLLDIDRSKPENIPPDLLPLANSTLKTNAAVSGSIGAGILVTDVMTTGSTTSGTLIGSAFLALAIHALIRKRKISRLLSEQKLLNTETGKPLNPA